MRIALVVHDYHRQGGHSRYTVELAERLAVLHEVHVFANRIDKGGRRDITFHRIPAVRATALTTVLTFPIPVSLAIGRRFDVVHSQGFACAGANVVTAHICNRSWYEARLASGDPIRPHERLFAAVASRAERSVYRNQGPSEVIAVSRLVGRNLAEAYGRTDRITVIPHGVDTLRFAPGQRAMHRAAVRREYGIPDDALVALWVGDLRKGARTAIDTIVAAPDWRLLTVSQTEPAPYAQYAAARNVATRITHAPPTDAIERAYAAADAFLFPSEYDAFGMVVTEAMASGLPVLVSRAAGAAELVEDSEGGMVLDAAAPAGAYAALLSEWAAVPCALEMAGAAARARVEPYTWDEIARRTLEVYERAASRKQW